MFEQLDDPDGFVPRQPFFTATARRFAARRRRAATRAVAGVVCAAAIAPVFIGALRSSPQGRIRPAGDSDVVDTIHADPAVQDTTPLGSGPTETSPTPESGATNFLIVGTDNASCSDADVRADTIMVLRLDSTNHRAALLSFPRDLWIDVPGGGKARINSTYRRDDPQMLIDTLSEEFGVPIDHYIQFDYCGFKKLVDAIGGVTIPTQYPLRDDTTGFSILESGCTTLDGDTALAYVRSRHLEYQDSAGVWRQDPSSDLGRIARQQDFVERFLHNASTAGMLDPLAITALYDAYRDDLVVDTGLTIDKLITVVRAISQIEPSNMPNYQIEVTGELVAGSSVLVPNKNSAAMKPILDIFRGLAPLTNEPVPADAPDTAATEPGANAPATNRPDTAIVPDASFVC